MKKGAGKRKRWKGLNERESGKYAIADCKGTHIRIYKVKDGKWEKKNIGGYKLESKGERKKIEKKNNVS